MCSIAHLVLAPTFSIVYGSHPLFLPRVFHQVTPLDIPEDEYMDAQFAARGIANLRIAKKTLDETGAPFFVAVGFHLPHEPYVFPTWAWQLYDDVNLPTNRGLIQVRFHALYTHKRLRRASSNC